MHQNIKRTYFCRMMEICPFDILVWKLIEYIAYDIIDITIIYRIFVNICGGKPDETDTR